MLSSICEKVVHNSFKVHNLAITATADLCIFIYKMLKNGSLIIKVKSFQNPDFPQKNPELRNSISASEVIKFQI